MPFGLGALQALVPGPVDCDSEAGRVRYFVSVIKPNIPCRGGHKARLCSMIHEALTLGDEVAGSRAITKLYLAKRAFSSQYSDYTMETCKITPLGHDWSQSGCAPHHFLVV